MSALTTPCHGAKLLVITRSEGSYQTRDVPDEIMCEAHGCTNSWNADGTVSYWNAESAREDPK